VCCASDSIPLWISLAAQARLYATDWIKQCLTHLVVTKQSVTDPVLAG